MFNQAGLSLEQAPPISVVLRFFITASVFGIVAGVLLLFFGSGVFDASSKEAVIITHILALGVMASFMLGALFQMLPVIAGVVLQNPKQKAMFVHSSFSVGVIMMALAFYSAIPFLYLVSGILLASSLLFATTIMIQNLRKLPSHSPSSRGMLFALGGFTVTIVLGLYLLLALGGYHDGVYFAEIKQTHYSFGLFGWVSLLIISISYQVIEMFYVTPKYPDIMRKYLIMILFALLLLSPVIPPIMIALALILYATITLLRLSKRKRPTSDGTVWFWRFGMGMLIVSMLLLLMNEEILKPLNYVTFIFFALSIVFAMVYKIVPFLVWFHLSNQGYMSAPLMFDIVHPKEIKQHFYLHVGAFVLWGLSIYHDSFIIPASLLVIASFSLLLYRIVKAWKIYRDTQKNGKKMVW